MRSVLRTARQGFSTGDWQSNMLTVDTTRATLTEHFIRHGDVLTVVSIVTDPVYLEEPCIRTSNYVLDLGQQLEPIHGEIVDEIAGRPDGYVPHHPGKTSP